MTETPCLTVLKYQRSSYTSTAIVFFFPSERNDAALAQKLRDFDQNTMMPFRRASMERIEPELRNVKGQQLPDRTHMAIAVEHLYPLADTDPSIPARAAGPLSKIDLDFGCPPRIISVALIVGLSLLVCPQLRTFSAPVGTSQRCQGTKSLRSSPLRGEQEPRGWHPVERTAMAGWQAQHDQVMYCRRGPRSRAPGAFKFVLTRINIEGWRALKVLAAEQEATLNALAVEAFNDLLKKHGKRQNVENPLLD